MKKLVVLLVIAALLYFGAPKVVEFLKLIPWSIWLAIGITAFFVSMAAAIILIVGILLWPKKKTTDSQDDPGLLERLKREESDRLQKQRTNGYDN